MSERKTGRLGWTAALALAVVAAGAGPGFAASDEENKKVERKIVVRSGDEPGQIFVWSSDDGEEATGGYLGVGLREETTSPEGGARVTSVVPDSPADKAGLKEDDVIVGIDGAVIRGPMALTEKIHAAKPGDDVKLDVVREGRRLSLSAELGKREPGVRFLAARRARELADKALELGELHNLDEEKARQLEEKLKELEEKLPPMIEGQLEGLEGLEGLERLGELGELRMLGPHGRLLWLHDKPRLGVEIVEATPELREHLGGSKDSGILVGSVLAGSAAEKAGIKVGDLIVSLDKEPIRDAGDLIEAVAGKVGKRVTIGVVRDGRNLTLDATLPEKETRDERVGPRALIRPPAPPAPPAAPARPARAPEPPAPSRLPNGNLV